MSHQSPLDQSGRFRLRIEEIYLHFPRLKGAISLELFVDSLKVLSLPPIKNGQPLHWKEIICCDVLPNSHFILRVYEKRHTWRPKCVGFIEYSAADLGHQLAASAGKSYSSETGEFERKAENPVIKESEDKAMTSTLNFSTEATAGRAYDDALTKAKSMEKQESILGKLGKTRASFKAILNFGSAVADLHPTSKLVFALCTKAWVELEKQEQCDDNVEDLLTGLARMLPLVESVKSSAKLDELRKIITSMSNLVEDASNFVIRYRSGGSAARMMQAFVDTKPREQVDTMLKKLQDLRNDFDTGMLGQIARGEATSAQSSLLKELKSIGRARYDPARACLPGTRESVIGDIIDWCHKSTESGKLLWVYGQAGLGKSSIAASLCQQLADQKALISSYFCKRDDPELRDPQCVLNTVIHDLAKHCPLYREEVAKTIQGDPNLCTSPMQLLFNGLVKDLSKSLVHVSPTGFCVVVDALDECGTSFESRRGLLVFLQIMSKLVPWLRIVITSRPNKDIQDFFGRLEMHCVSSFNLQTYNASDDIRRFIDDRMSSVAQDNAWPNNTIDRLSTFANDLFIWAQTACTFILSGADPTARLNLILDGTPPGGSTSSLDLLYTTAIKNSMQDSGEDNIQLVRRCLGFIIACSTRTPLSISSLEKLLDGRMRSKVLLGVVGRLSSVLYIDNANGGVVRVYHPSFADYMTSSSRSGIFCVDLDQQNIELAGCCLTTMMSGLRFNICGLETSHKFNRDVPELKSRVALSIPLELSYSCMHWISHLTTAPRGALQEALRGFLFGTVLLYWIEALSLLGMLSIAPSGLQQLIRWTSDDMQDCMICASDAYRFVLAFYDAISESTPHLYVTALALAPMESAIAKRLQSQFPNVIRVTRGGNTKWPATLRSISQNGIVSSVAFSPEGRSVVSGSWDNALRIWDVETGTELTDPLVGHSDGVFAVVFSPGGRLIVSGSRDSTLRIWDVETGTALGGPLVGHSDSVNSVAFSPDGRLIASGSSDNTLRIWDVETGTSLGDPLTGHSDSVFSVVFSPDGHRIASGSSDNTLRIWDVETGIALSDPLMGHSDSVFSVAFSPDGRLLASGSSDNTLRIWDVETGTSLGEPLVGHSDNVNSIAFSPTGRCIVSGSLNSTLRMWDVETGTGLGEPLVGHSDSVNSVAFSPDGHHILSGSSDSTLCIWNVETLGATLGDPIVGHSNSVNSLAFSPSGRLFVSGSWDNTLCIWDVETGAALGDPLVGHSDSVNTVAFSPNGRLIASGSSDNTLRIWEVETSIVLGEPLVGHSDSVNSVAFSPDSRLIVSGSSDSTLRIWDAETGTALSDALVGHYSGVFSVAFSPDVRLIVSGSWDCTLRIWDVETCTSLGDPLVGHSSGVNSVAFSPNGHFIVSGSRDSTLCIWDVETGEALGEPLVGHSDSVNSVAFSSDGRLIVSGSWDGTLLIWDVETCTTLGEALVGHSHSVNSVAFSPSSDRIVSGSSDHTVRVWNAAPRLTMWPRNTSRLSQHPRGDGWVFSKDIPLLLWLPSEYRRGEPDDASLVISKKAWERTITLDFSTFVHGESWTQVALRPV